MLLTALADSIISLGQCVTSSKLHLWELSPLLQIRSLRKLLLSVEVSCSHVWLHPWVKLRLICDSWWHIISPASDNLHSCPAIKHTSLDLTCDGKVGHLHMMCRLQTNRVTWSAYVGSEAQNPMVLSRHHTSGVCLSHAQCLSLIMNKLFAIHQVTNVCTATQSSHFLATILLLSCLFGEKEAIG